jgi:hypothetical protein
LKLPWFDRNGYCLLYKLLSIVQIRGPVVDTVGATFVGRLAEGQRRHDSDIGPTPGSLSGAAVGSKLVVQAIGPPSWGNPLPGRLSASAALG